MPILLSASRSSASIVSASSVRLMIIAEQVEESVHDQMRHMRFKRLFRKSRLAPHRLRRQHDISEKRPDPCGKERTLVGLSLPRKALLRLWICASSVKRMLNSSPLAGECRGGGNALCATRFGQRFRPPSELPAPPVAAAPFPRPVAGLDQNLRLPACPSPGVYHTLIGHQRKDPGYGPGSLVEGSVRRIRRTSTGRCRCRASPSSRGSAGSSP